MKLLLIILLLFSVSGFTQASYKTMMLDNSVNFYAVCAVADAHFKNIDKNAKGSGWKGYQRWKYLNESKYYPTGDRSMEDPYLVRKAYEAFITTTPKTAAGLLFGDGWKELGPNTVDEISGHYSVGLGRIETHYVSPVDPNIMYVGSRSGGFWSSNNAGDTWSGGSTDFLFASGVNSIGVSPTNSDSILINIRNSGNTVSHGVYRSTNGGTSWDETNFNPTVLGLGGLGSTFRINRVVYHPRIPDLIFICSVEGLYRSDDNLETWVKETEGRISDIEFHPTNDDIIYIYDYDPTGGNRNKVLRSVDGGLNFSGSAEIAGNADNTSVQLDVSPICADCIYFASENGIWKSFDSGLTFNFVSNPDKGSEGFAVSDLDTTKVIIGYLDCFASENGGTSFNQVTWWNLDNSIHGPGSFKEKYDNSTQYIHADVREAECQDGIFYVSTDGHFAKSTDNGLTWENLTDGIGIRENYTLGISQSNHYITMVGSQDNGTSIRNKDGWLEFWGADGMEAIIHPLNPNWMIGSNQYGGRRRTFDGGLTQNGFSPSGHSSSWIAPLAYDPNDHQTFYHFGESVYRSEDFGNSFTNVGVPSFSGQILQAAIAENNTDIIIVARNGNIERSINGGSTFTDITGTLPDYWIQDIAFDPKNDSTFIVTYHRYQDDGEKIFITHDLGNTWINITANLNGMPIRGAVIDHSSASNIYLAAEIGVYMKAMDATDWVLYNTDLPNCTIFELEINNGSNALRAATWGRGVWEYTLKDRANYPAILTTTITDLPTYELPKEGVEQFVTSKIHYDATLSEVYTNWSIDAPTFENSIPMENISDSTWVTETAIPNYPSGTKMFFKVFAIGASGDTTETYKFMYTVHPFEYCSASGTSTTSSNYIDFVGLEEISNSSTQDYYGNYTGISTKLYTDSIYTLQADLFGSFSSDEMGAWIDYNNNAEFEDHEFIMMSDFDTDNRSFGTFTVPNTNIAIGETVRMRVRNSFSSSMAPCGNVTGEVEDYSIELLCLTNTVSIEEEACYNYTSPSGLYTWSETGLYSDTLVNEHGCDSILMIELQINHTLADISPIVCESYTSPSGLYTWTTAGIYTDTITNTAGCDSIITINLSIAMPTDSSISISVCETYTSPSGLYTWTSTGTYTDTLTSAHGCDSLITINLSIVDEILMNLSITACEQYTSPSGSYTWNVSGVYQDTVSSIGSCDSIFTINLTIGEEEMTAMTVTECESYMSPSGSYTWDATGIYMDTLTSITGCDSILTINLTITEVNVTVTPSDYSLSADATGTTYQWLDCNNSWTEIIGATNQTFAPIDNGSYAVIINNAGCSDTSNCYDITSLGIHSFEVNNIHLYPNPSDGAFNIDFGQLYPIMTIQIHDPRGKLIFESVYTDETKVAINLNEAFGVYFITMRNNSGKQYRQKIILE